MSLFEDILKGYESRLTESQTQPFDNERFQEVRDLIGNYQKGIESGTLTGDQREQYEVSIQGHIDAITNCTMPDDQITQYADLPRQAYNIGVLPPREMPAIPKLIIVIENQMIKESVEPELIQAFRSTTGFLDAGLDPKAAVERGIEFASKRFNLDVTKFKYKHKEGLMSRLKRLYPSLMFEQNLSESALPQGGEIADKKNFNPDNPEVYVYGYGRLEYDQIKARVTRELKNYTKQVESGNYSNLHSALSQQGGVLASMVAALDQVDKELASPTMKRKITLMNRKQASEIDRNDK